MSPQSLPPGFLIYASVAPELLRIPPVPAGRPSHMAFKSILDHWTQSRFQASSPVIERYSGSLGPDHSQGERLKEPWHL